MDVSRETIFSGGSSESEDAASKILLCRPSKKQNCFFADSGKGHGMPVKNENVRKNNGTKDDQNVTARPREPLLVLIDVLMTEDASFIALFILNLF